MSNAIEEFSRFAHHYNQYNVIQSKVASLLIDRLTLQEYRSILDLGCGSGEIFRNLQDKKISFETLVALDSAQEMLDIHPDDARVEKIYENFNNINFTKNLPQHDYDLVLSSSALQWSTNLDFTLSALVTLSKTLHTAIFTSGTFKTLHKVGNIYSPIYSAEVTKESILRHYKNVEFELQHYMLTFDSTREMFRYIKKSGVSGGEKRLNYTETKHLMEAYPLNYLEFEVLFVHASNNT